MVERLFLKETMLIVVVVIIVSNMSHFRCKDGQKHTPEAGSASEHTLCDQNWIVGFLQEWATKRLTVKIPFSHLSTSLG